MESQATIRDIDFASSSGEQYLPLRPFSELGSEKLTVLVHMQLEYPDLPAITD